MILLNIDILQESNYIHSNVKQKNYNNKPVVISYEAAVNARKKPSETKLGPKVVKNKNLQLNYSI